MNLIVAVTYTNGSTGSFGPFNRRERAEECIVKICGNENVKQARIRQPDKGEDE